ncbi:MAG: hypothetical protein CSA81_03145 [Acidobacteria bacterium]|nr:MAG: hypothetical protein CSA81_03145 [Acidobacteriota bacterium]
MRLIHSEIKENLMNKIEILAELVEGQEKMKAFLIKPVWSKYFHFVEPQERLLKKLQDNVLAQKVLFMKMAAKFKLPPNTPFGQLLKLLPTAEREELIPLLEASSRQAQKLKSRSNLSKRLFHAQNEFTQQWMSTWQKKQVPSLSLYNAFGQYVHKPASSVFLQDA